MVILPALLLLSLGIAVISSSSVNLALQQLIFAVLGFLSFFLLSRFDYHTLRFLIKPLYIINLLLLILVLFLGYETRGSIRWIPLGIFNFQPSEFAKISLILLLADFWSNRKPSWKNIGLSLVWLLPFVFLVFRQPDLGTTLTLIFIWLLTLIMANISYFKILIISGLTIFSMPLVWFFLKEYQKQRITSFLIPTEDRLNLGYNAIQSMIAVGSGELFGRGLGRGTQSRLQFLPEFRTDFIFAFIAEELGFLGAVIVISLYFLLFYFTLKVLFETDDLFGQLILIGVMGMLFFQIVVNIGMNIGILPITGITLPLLSYGGSSLITVLISLGLIASVRKFAKKRLKIDTFSLQR